MIKKYLTAFDSEALYNAFKISEDYITPNVSLIRTFKQLYFNKAVETNGISLPSKIEIPLTPPVANPFVALKKYIPVDIIRIPRLRKAK